MFETKQVVCTRCENVGKPKSRTKGSFLIEVVLWLCFIIPGILYSLWRVSSRERVCRNCGSKEIVPIDSPMGKKILARTNHKDTPSAAKSASGELAELFKLKEQGAITEEEFTMHKAKLLN